MKSIYTLLLLITVICMTACNKMDENGALDGNWQLTEWRTATGDSIIATNHTRKIYYTVKYDILKFQDMLDASNYHCLAYFRHQADTLVVERAFSQPFDDVIPLDSLANYGCPANGRYLIRRLTHEHLVLSSDLGVLTFRKF